MVRGGVSGGDGMGGSYDRFWANFASYFQRVTPCAALLVDPIFVCISVGVEVVFGSICPLVGPPMLFAFLSARKLIGASVSAVPTSVGIAQMVRVDAPAHPTKVIDLQSSGPRAASQLQSDRCRLSREPGVALSVNDISVATCPDLSQPRMTTALRNRHREPGHYLLYRLSLMVVPHCYAPGRGVEGVGAGGCPPPGPPFPPDAMRCNSAFLTVERNISASWVCWTPAVGACCGMCLESRLSALSTSLCGWDPGGIPCSASCSMAIACCIFTRLAALSP